jgi:hypothetical protein
VLLICIYFRALITSLRIHVIRCFKCKYCCGNLNILNTCTPDAAFSPITHIWSRVEIYELFDLSYKDEKDIRLNLNRIRWHNRILDEFSLSSTPISQEKYGRRLQQTAKIKRYSSWMVFSAVQMLEKLGGRNSALFC